MGLFRRRNQPSRSGSAEIPQRFKDAVDAMLDSPFAVPALVFKHPGLFGGRDAEILREIGRASGAAGERQAASIIEHSVDLGGRMLQQFQSMEIDEEGKQQSGAGAHVLSRAIREQIPSEAFRHALGILFMETAQGMVSLSEVRDEWPRLVAAIDTADAGVDFPAALGSLQRIAASNASYLTRSRAALLLALLAWWMRDWRALVDELDRVVDLSRAGPRHNLAELAGGYLPLTMHLVAEARAREPQVARAVTWRWLDDWLGATSRELSTAAEAEGNGELLQLLGRALTLVHWTWNHDVSPFRRAGLGPPEALFFMSRVDEQTSDLWELASWLRGQLGSVAP